MPVRRWPKIGQLFLVLLLLTVTGCTLKAPVSETKLVELTEFSTRGTTPLTERWWEQLKDPHLDALIQEALGNNFSIKIAWERLLQSQGALQQTSAASYPTLTTGANGARQRQATDISTTESDNYSLNINAGYEIDLWGRVKAAKNAKKLEFNATKEDLQAAALSLSGKIASAWYRLQGQHLLLQLLDQQMQARQKALQIVEQKFRSGVNLYEDLLQQQQLIAAAKGEQLAGEIELKQLQLSLALLLGRTPDTANFPMTGFFPPEKTLPDTGLPAELVQRRPDVRAALLRVKAADQQVAAAIAEQFPRLSLAANYSTSTAEISDLFSNWLTNLAANISAPLLDGGLRKANIVVQKSVARQALYAYGDVVLNAFTEVEKALSDEQKYNRYQQSLIEQAKLAEKVRHNLLSHYRKGSVSYQRVLSAQISELETTERLLDSNWQQIENRLQLLLSLAGSWQLEQPTATTEQDFSHAYK